MKQPVLPSKPILKILFTIYDEMTLDQIRNRLLEEVKLDNISNEVVNTAVVTKEYGRYGDDSTVVVKGISLPDEIDYEDRVREYWIKEEEYLAWWGKNKDKVISARKNRENRAKQARIVELEKELEALKNG